MAPLHVTNGESAAGSLKATGLKGEVLSWDDVLHVGPLAFDPSESRPLRAALLAQYGWGAGEIEARLERRDADLDGAGYVVLWFEHDLFDQLQPLQVLSQLGPEQHVELFQANQEQEDAIFLGDIWCFSFLDELERDGLVASSGKGSLDLTAAGRALVE